MGGSGNRRINAPVTSTRTAGDTKTKPPGEIHSAAAAADSVKPTTCLSCGHQHQTWLMLLTKLKVKF